ncbi:MAG: hypothetical protein HY898_22390 [Deltaproteobacteria bacterium]|nr:hypothetical protein [Deltaproteobacteria bacterium]
MMHNLERSALVIASLWVASCGGEGGAATPAPTFQVVVDASADVSAEASDAAAEQPEASPDAPVVPKRKVMTRNPFGNVARSANLMLDGDFEWLGGYTSQYPWLQISPLIVSFEAPAIVTGAKCRSGLRCASLGVGESIAGIGVITHDPSVDVSVWMHLPTTDCELVGVSLGACFQQSPVQLVTAASPTADADGWCHYQSSVTPPQSTPCVFVSNDATEDVVLVDDVVLEGAASSGANARSLRSPGPRHLAAVERLRAAARDFATPKPPRRPGADPTEFAGDLP